MGQADHITSSRPRGAGGRFPSRRAWRAGIAAFAVLSAGAWGPLPAAPAAQAADLRVEVTGLRSGEGDVHMAVYATPATFPEPDGAVAEAVVPARAAGVQWVFSGLAPGRYALAVYHDENRNNEFDQGFLGIPLEGYGFSNDAGVFFGPPDFASAAVQVPQEGTRITIHMTY